MKGECENVLTNIVKRCLDENIKEEDYTCDFYYNEKDWVDPWCGIRCKNITDNYRDGIYVKYQWNEENHLSLGICFGEDAIPEIIRFKMYSYLIQKFSPPDGFSEDDNIKDKYLFRKVYDFNNLNEEELLGDLKSILKSYDDIIPILEKFYKENNILSKNIDGRIRALIINKDTNSTNTSAYKKYKEHIVPLVIGSLFNGYTFKKLDKDILGKKSDTGWYSAHVLYYLGLGGNSGFFEEESISKAISELKATENPDYSELIDILENISEPKGIIEFNKNLTETQAEYLIDFDTLIQQKRKTQRSYNAPQDFFYYAKNFGIINRTPEEDNTRKSKNGDIKVKQYFLSEDYSFKLGLGVLWIIGEKDVDDKYASEKYKFFVSTGINMQTHKKIKPQIYKTEYSNKSQQEDGYKWFVELYDKNLAGNDIIFSIDHENKVFTFDVLFNAVQSLISYEDIIDREEEMLHHNQIYFGAPGTGKSFNLNSQRKILLKDCPNNYERVTFHPDYSYANFVGTYKPVPDKDNERRDIITYKYVPGPFMRVLVDSIINDDKHHLLIIEEINRANVAAVFGDVFQLLDRDENNESEFPIKASEDIKSHLKNVFEKEFGEDFEEKYNRAFPNDELKIPNNMFIWATMNSADQGVYVMDTAFKRRWDFKYLGIDDSSNRIERFEIDMPDGKTINWNCLRKAINGALVRHGVNEDKLLGPFFINPRYLPKDSSNNKGFIETFKNKVLMYLFEDIDKSKRNFLFDIKPKYGHLLYSEVCDKFEEKGIDIFEKKITDEYENLFDEYQAIKGSKKE